MRADPSVEIQIPAIKILAKRRARLGSRACTEDASRALLQRHLPSRDLVRVHVEELGHSASVFSPLIADSATFALKAGLWVRLVRFVMFAPDSRQHCRRQAENPPIGLSEFPRPPLAMEMFGAKREFWRKGTAALPRTTSAMRCRLPAA